LLPPEMSNQVLRCIIDPTDISGLVNRVTISSGSIRFLIDNARMEVAAWACESSCFANNPHQDLSEGLGTLEKKADRSATCNAPRPNCCRMRHSTLRHG